MAKTAPALLSVTGVEFHRGKPILKGIDWEMKQGEHWAILGANGCGKTSLLQIILGYESPSAGQISLLGKQYGEVDWRELRPLLGWVSAATAKRIEDSELVIDAVASGRKALLNYWTMPPKSELREARAWLQRTGISHLENAVWAQLSQGEKQRVLIGRACMARSRMLFLDEPCAGLDPVSRERFLMFLRKILQEPKAPGLVLVTHHVEEILPEITHVLVLREGRVAASGPRNKVMTSAVLSEAFGAPVQLRRSRNRYILEFAGAEDGAREVL
jgi:iron complex transport system ATP-binding protein